MSLVTQMEMNPSRINFCVWFDVRIYFFLCEGINDPQIIYRNLPFYHWFTIYKAAKISSDLIYAWIFCGTPFYYSYCCIGLNVLTNYAVSTFEVITFYYFKSWRQIGWIFLLSSFSPLSWPELPNISWSMTHLGSCLFFHRSLGQKKYLPVVSITW